MAEDIGENLVGSYLRYVVGCEFVVYNTQYPGIQGEIDVVAMKLSGEQREVWFCEVVTHIRGTMYGTYDKTVTKLGDKLSRAKDFAVKMFPGDKHYFEVWSPKVPQGALSKQSEQMERRLQRRRTRLAVRHE